MLFLPSNSMFAVFLNQSYYTLYVENCWVLYFTPSVVQFNNFVCPFKTVCFVYVEQTRAAVHLSF